jgi:hypothetical protein
MCFMARHLRIEFAQAFCHVMARGNVVVAREVAQLKEKLLPPDQQDDMKTVIIIGLTPMALTL